jgi:hypothetical protein
MLVEPPLPPAAPPLLGLPALATPAPPPIPPGVSALSLQAAKSSVALAKSAAVDSWRRRTDTGLLMGLPFRIA